MNKPRLIYFDAPVSRGEECRLALHIAGVDFEDARVPVADWPAMKDRMPYGSLPVLELPNRGAFAHSNAILVLIGRRHGLHPKDDFEAARHEGMMQHVEDLRAAVSPTSATRLSPWRRCSATPPACPTSRTITGTNPSTTLARQNASSAACAIAK